SATSDTLTRHHALPILHRTLGDQHFILPYRVDGPRRTLTLLGGSETVTAPTRVVKGGPGGQPATMVELMQRSVPVPAGSKLARFLGHDTATLQQLADIARSQDDVGLRMEAMRAGVGAIDSQHDLPAATVKSLGEVDDTTLQNLLQGMAGDRARETVSQLATLSHTAEIRTRLLKVLRNMNAAGAGGTATN